VIKNIEIKTGSKLPRQLQKPPERCTECYAVVRLRSPTKRSRSTKPKWGLGADIMNPIEQHRENILMLCKLHHVSRLYLFGSALTSHFNDDSDIDLLIQFGDVNLADYFSNYMDLKEKLEELFQRPVDLVEEQAVRNPIFRQVLNREKKMIYEREIA
jgi:predicted nucleotidyltransferase